MTYKTKVCKKCKQEYIVSSKCRLDPYLCPKCTKAKVSKGQNKLRKVKSKYEQ